MPLIRNAFYQISRRFPISLFFFFFLVYVCVHGPFNNISLIPSWMFIKGGWKTGASNQGPLDYQPDTHQTELHDQARIRGDWNIFVINFFNFFLCSFIINSFECFMQKVQYYVKEHFRYPLYTSDKLQRHFPKDNYHNTDIANKPSLDNSWAS